MWDLLCFTAFHRNVTFHHGAMPRTVQSDTVVKTSPNPTIPERSAPSSPWYLSLSLNPPHLLCHCPSPQLRLSYEIHYHKKTFTTGIILLQKKTQTSWHISIFATQACHIRQTLQYQYSVTIYIVRYITEYVGMTEPHSNRTTSHLKLTAVVFVYILLLPSW